ncbi:ribonuclease R [Desmospora sp. 8437]|uniref:Ribonuclease R n=2 Tax=Kroppenstedtia eburnea TaxID=714067 RepID=A0A1N7JYV3_9BACL|nr:ribonuclease R [Kroppenstedtia eburnea]EGK10854.1 ribonuclease R [Desmospora sp. 8437]SIS54519.1 RNAse R [Kroppenstedtia eburnea]
MEPEILKFMRKNAYKPLTAEELHQSFADLEWDTFIGILNQMEAEGKIVRTRTHRYGVPERLNLVRGRLQGNAKGFGFVLPDAEFPFEQDVFIHGTDMNGAMDGDFVLARVESYKKEGMRPEGEIVRILKRGRTEAVGTYTASKHFGFVIPDDKRLSSDIFIPKEAKGDAKEGDKVVVELTGYPKGRRSAEGRVKEVLGHKDDPGVDILSIIRKYHLPEEFPEEVMEEADAVPDSITADEIQGRRDLRGRRMVTIDGEDAKDLDDAVSVEQLDNGNIRLGVHIADVSYYVKEGSALDREAYLRGNSVYLVDRVIPMLPKRLSNGICSLNPQVDRLTMTCDMELDGQGNLIHHEIYPSVIQTDERMTYHDVKRILVDEDPELIKRYQPLVENFRLMGRLAETLRQRRVARGAIDFDFPEAKILVDPQGKPMEIVKRPRTVAEQMIEEFMLAANETVSEHFFKLKIPFMYRIHERPNPEKLQSFFEFITRFGHSVRGKADRIKPRALQQLLEEIKGEPEEPVISRVMLRSMQQAKYSPECLGHFGLAAQYYSHFTSPIRRYPDLAIHRIIREVWENKGKLPDKRRGHFKEWLPTAADHTSDRERIAIDAERETDDLKKAEFMMDKVGQTFKGTISSVTSFGVFVELENTVEGLVHVSYMTDDYYHFNEYTMSLIGERTGKAYNIGDQVEVRVTGVNLDERKVDFEFTEREDSDTPRATTVPSTEPEVKKLRKPVATHTIPSTSGKPSTGRRRKSKEKGPGGKRNRRKG